MCSAQKYSVLRFSLHIIILKCAMVKCSLNGESSNQNARLQLQNVIITGGRNETVGIFFPYSNVSIVYHYPFNVSAYKARIIYSGLKPNYALAIYFSVRRYNNETEELRITGWDRSVAGTYVFALVSGGGDPAVEVTWLETDPVCGTNVNSGSSGSSETSFSLPSNIHNVQLFCSIDYVGNLVPANKWRILKVMDGAAIHVVNYTPRTVNFSDGAGTRRLTFLVDLVLPQTLVPMNYNCETWIFFNQQSISHSLGDENLIFSQEIASYSFLWMWEIAVPGTMAERRFSVTDISVVTSRIHDDANKLWMLVAFIVLGVIVVAALLSLTVASVRIRNKRIQKDTKKSQQRPLIAFNIDLSYEGLITPSDSSNSIPLTADLSGLHHVDENSKSAISTKEKVQETENEYDDPQESLSRNLRMNDIRCYRPSVTTPKSAKVGQQIVQYPLDPPVPSSEGQPYYYDIIDNVLSVGAQHDVVNSCGMPEKNNEEMLPLDARGYETYIGNVDDGHNMDSMKHIKSSKTTIHPDILPAQYEELDTVKPMKNLKKTKDYVNVPKALSCTRQNRAILSLRHLAVPPPPAMTPGLV